MAHSTHIRDFAKRYTAAGLSVLPIRADGTKAPAIRSWQELQARIGTEAELDSWFSNGCGIGVIAGAVSGGLEILDFDAPGIFERFTAAVDTVSPGLLERLPHIATPGDGHHLFLRCSDVDGNQKLAMSAANKVLIETRGQGGYVLTVGSPARCHTSGRLYQHVDGPAIEDVPTISADDRDILLRVARSFDEREQVEAPAAAAPRPERTGLPPGDDFAARTSWHEILTPHGWTCVADGLWRRPGKTTGVSASTKATSKAGNELLRVFSSNAHPFEADTSYGKFAAFATLNHSGDFAAAAAALGSNGFGEQTAPRRKLKVGGVEVDIHVGSVPDAFAMARPPIVFERITAAELDSGDYHTEFLIDGTMTAGQPLIVAGGKKQLKTNILLDAAISLATAGKFLGSLAVTRAARVAVMSGESGMATIQETCRRICKAKGLELRHVEGLIFSPDLPRLDDVRYLDAVETFVTGDEIEVVVFDPAYLMMPGGDAGNLFVQGEMLRSISQRCEQLGVTMVLCHHTKKGILDPYSPPELEHIAWAGFQEFARQWWLIGRREPYESGTGYHALWLNIGGSAGHSALWGANIQEGVYRGLGTRTWDVELLTAEESREESVSKVQDVKQANKERQRAAEMKACKESILLAFNGLPDHRETLTRLKERCGKRGVAFDAALGELLREGSVKATEIVRNNGQKYEGYERVYPAE